MAELCAGRQPTAAETREFFDIQWKQTIYFQSQDTIPPKQNKRRVMEGLRACSRLRDLLWRHEILQPLSRYELPIGGVAITGEYMVLRSPRRKKHAYVPYLRYQGVKIRPVIPDVVSFARWVDARNRWLDSARRTGGIDRIGVLHYWVSQNLAAEYQPDPAFAGQVLIGATGVIAGRPFPRSGDHCLSCPTRACKFGGSTSGMSSSAHRKKLIHRPTVWRSRSRLARREEPCSNSLQRVRTVVLNRYA
jgi:hypothetical protein